MTGRPLPDLPEISRSNNNYSKSRHSVLEESLDRDIGRSSSLIGSDIFHKKMDYILEEF